MAARATVPAVITVGSEPIGKMAADFAGLSYESTQLYNPDFFSSSNTALIQHVRGLGRGGVLRLGGNLSDYSLWRSDAGDFMTPKLAAAIEHGKTYWEWKLCDARVGANRGGAITPDAIARLRSFLDATGWKTIYGLNFGSGDAARARDEAAHVAQLLGDRLMAFQIGNEADFYAGNPFFRSKDYDIEEYFRGYQSFVAAIRESVPNALFAGPDTAVNMDWVNAFAARFPDAALLSSHYYAMGPAKDPAMNAQRLLNSNAGLEARLARARETRSRIPFRLTETNSCYGGGRQGVSDAFAGALWCADMMLQAAQGGCAGTDLHGGGDGIYTPIESRDELRSTPRPLYFGMQFAAEFAQAEMLPSTTDAGLRVYAGRRDREFLLAVINKTAEPAAFTLRWEAIRGRKVSRALRLTAPSLEAKTGVRLEPLSPKRPASIPAYSAMLLAWE